MLLMFHVNVLSVILKWTQVSSYDMARINQKLDHCQRYISGFQPIITTCWELDIYLAVLKCRWIGKYIYPSGTKEVWIKLTSWPIYKPLRGRCSVLLLLTSCWKKEFPWPDIKGKGQIFLDRVVQLVLLIENILNLKTQLICHV